MLESEEERSAGILAEQASSEVEPYKFLRHPFYLSYMVAFLGAGRVSVAGDRCDEHDTYRVVRLHRIR